MGFLGLAGFVVGFRVIVVLVVVVLVLRRPRVAAGVDIWFRAAVSVDTDANAFLPCLEVMHFFCSCADTLRSTICKPRSSVCTGPSGRVFINACATDTGRMTGRGTGGTFSNPGGRLEVRLVAAPGGYAQNQGGRLDDLPLGTSMHHLE